MACNPKHTWPSRRITDLRPAKGDKKRYCLGLSFLFWFMFSFCVLYASLICLVFSVQCYQLLMSLRWVWVSFHCCHRIPVWNHSSVFTKTTCSPDARQESPAVLVGNKWQPQAPGELCLRFSCPGAGRAACSPVQKVAPCSHIPRNLSSGEQESTALL